MYTVKDRRGREIRKSEIITDYRGEAYVFNEVTQAPDKEHAARISATGGFGLAREFYASDFGLSIETS